VQVAVDGVVVARAWFGDALRPDAAAALRGLRARGWKLELLSGDDPAVVGEVGRQLGFDPRDCRGGASPEDKLGAIERVLRSGPVAMVGDGVNDAAAIARATVGIGVHGGAEACLAAADVFLARPGPASLVALADGARRTLQVIRRNIAFSIGYNLIGATLAVTGVINPLAAAVLMPLSSLTVVLASWAGRTFDRNP
jgi:Cu2+-exporting ATPase